MLLAMDNGCGVVGDVSYFAPDGPGYGLPYYWRMTFWGREGVLETATNDDHLELGTATEQAGRAPAPAAGQQRRIPSGLPQGHPRRAPRGGGADQRPGAGLHRDGPARAGGGRCGGAGGGAVTGLTAPESAGFVVDPRHEAEVTAGFAD